MLDPTWKDLGRYNEGWIDQTKASYRGIELFLQGNAQKIADLKWSMRFYVYQSLPNWYGLLLGDDLLFRGTTFWEDKRLRAGSNMIEQHRASDVVRGKQIVSEFIEWFNFSKQREVSPS